MLQKLKSSAEGYKAVGLKKLQFFFLKITANEKEKGGYLSFGEVFGNKLSSLNQKVHCLYLYTCIILREGSNIHVIIAITHFLLVPSEIISTWLNPSPLSWI